MVHTRTLVAFSLVVLVTFSQFTHAQSSSNVDQLTRLLRHIDAILASFRNKRGCRGYICGHSHISSAAGNKSMQNYLNSYFYKCAKDPNCSPGKRRKRSIAKSSAPSIASLPMSASPSSQQGSILLGRLRQISQHPASTL